MQVKANTMPSKQKKAQMKVQREKQYNNESSKNIATYSINLKVLIKQELRKKMNCTSKHGKLCI